MLSALVSRFVSLVLFLILHLYLTRAYGVNYFAFGSNMSPDVLLRRTGSTSFSKAPYRAVLNDFEVKFNVRPGGVVRGPAFASVERRSGGETHGLLYELSLSQFFRLLLSEGMGLAYDLSPCYVLPYSARTEGGGLDGDEGFSLVRAYTLTSSRTSRTGDDGLPSKRYKKLLVSGAEEQGLDEEYVEQLRALETFQGLSIL